MYSNTYFSYDSASPGGKRPPWQKVAFLILIAILAGIAVFAQETTIKTSKASYWKYKQGYNKLLKEGPASNEFIYNNITQSLKIKIGVDSFEHCIDSVTPDRENGRVILYTQDYILYLYESQIFMIFNYDTDHFFLFNN